jgi:hypothetical protein
MLGKCFTTELYSQPILFGILDVLTFVALKTGEERLTLPVLNPETYL